MFLLNICVKKYIDLPCCHLPLAYEGSLPRRKSSRNWGLRHTNQYTPHNTVPPSVRTPHDTRPHYTVCHTIQYTPHYTLASAIPCHSLYTQSAVCHHYTSMIVLCIQKHVLQIPVLLYILVGGSLVHQSVFTGRWLSVVEIHSGNFILTNVLSVNNLAKLTDYQVVVAGPLYY